jgi:hypothetical protein
LCSVIDKYSEAYLARLKHIEQVMEITNFEKSRLFDKGFRLVKIDRELWYQLIYFSNEFDHKKGNTTWHIFDYSHAHTMIKIYDGNTGYHAGLYPENAENSGFSSFEFPDNDIWVVWAPPPTWPEKLESYNEKQIWTAKKTCKWLVDKLIPYSCFHFSRNNKIFTLKSKEKLYERYRKNFQIEFYIRSCHKKEKLNINEINNKELIITALKEFQAFFRDLDGIYLNSSDLYPLYETAIYCLKQNPLEYYDYVAHGFSPGGENNPEKLIEEIESYKETIKDGPQNTTLLDYSFRSLLELVDNENIKFSEKEAKDIAESFYDLWEKMEFHKMITRVKSY